MIINEMALKPSDKSVKGNCAGCGIEVYEALWLLDDAYNVWMGKCPSCKALNYLSMSFYLRGYTRTEMWLVLPTAEEIVANGLPADTPTSGIYGKPADQHGSTQGELLHRLAEGSSFSRKACEGG